MGTKIRDKRELGFETNGDFRCGMEQLAVLADCVVVPHKALKGIAEITQLMIPVSEERHLGVRRDPVIVPAYAYRQDRLFWRAGW